MFNFSLVLILVLMCNGCASSTPNSSVVENKSVKVDRLKKYASNVGCKMLENGYMVCPKEMK
ncbi:MAG: Unknown protein [uncultured Sulfurovum sp.]|uniref:Lipoprotein n=1 Tax=uncultured Sulfurovum sp. TaxID=269237 RepID=A0A6S6TXC4_9BACT|nr:MAG: Unknown protein [uncultured Sulfurovum sp.]